MLLEEASLKLSVLENLGQAVRQGTRLVTLLRSAAPELALHSCWTRNPRLRRDVLLEAPADSAKDEDCQGMRKIMKTGIERIQYELHVSWWGPSHIEVRRPSQHTTLLGGPNAKPSVEPCFFGVRTSKTTGGTAVGAKLPLL